MATVALEGLHLYAHHGVSGEERVIGGQYVLDVYFTLDIEAAAESDDVSQTADYSLVAPVAQAVLDKPRRLLETLVVEVASELLTHLPMVQAVKVRLSKLNPPLGAVAHRTFVEYDAQRSAS